MLVALRVSMPDRAGMLAQVAAALAEAGADIVTIGVVDRSEGLVVDELCLELGGPDPAAAARLIESVPGVVVESARSVTEPPSATSALELAARLAHAGEDALEVLVAGVPAALQAAWCLAVTTDAGCRPRTLAQSATSPRITSDRLPWIPLGAPRRLAAAGWMPTSWRMRAALGGLELAAWPLGHPDEALLVARHSGQRFRPPELRQLELLVSIALGQLSTRPSDHPDPFGRRARVGATRGGSPGILG